MQSSEKSLMKYIGRIILIFLVVTVGSCTEKVSLDHNKEEIVSPGESTIRIVFFFPGDDISSPEYQNILHNIIASIKSREAGEIKSSGFGMGTMEIVIRVKGRESIKKIKTIIADNYPNANYSIKSFDRMQSHGLNFR